MTSPNAKLFNPFTFKNGIVIKNRITMAPMTTWASNDDYTISDEEVKHYHARADGPGLVITGCSRVMANGIGFSHEFASYDDAFLPGLKRLASAAKSGGASAILQIYHAGNKAVSALIPDGDLVSASAIGVEASAFVTNNIIPRALTNKEIIDIVKAFGAATKRAIEAGFDGVELHGAHGFLLQNFFSPIYNQRDDNWGGSPVKRMHFPLAVVNEVKKVIREFAIRPFLLGYRISPEESEPQSYKVGDTYPLIDQLIESGIDYLHISLSNVLEARQIGVAEGKTLAGHVIDHVNGRIPVMAAGQIKTPDDAVKALDIGLSFTAIGQAFIINPNWVELVANGERVEESLSLSKAPGLAIPAKLLTVINAMKGWFSVSI